MIKLAVATGRARDMIYEMEFDCIKYPFMNHNLSASSQITRPGHSSSNKQAVSDEFSSGEFSSNSSSHGGNGREQGVYFGSSEFPNRQQGDNIPSDDFSNNIDKYDAGHRVKSSFDGQRRDQPGDGELGHLGWSGGRSSDWNGGWDCAADFRADILACTARGEEERTAAAMAAAEQRLWRRSTQEERHRGVGGPATERMAGTPPTVIGRPDGAKTREGGAGPGCSARGKQLQRRPGGATRRRRGDAGRGGGERGRVGRFPNAAPSRAAARSAQPITAALAADSARAGLLPARRVPQPPPAAHPD